MADDTWCSTPGSSISATAAGSVIQTTPICMGYDDTYYDYDFNPNTATGSSSTCTDLAPTWVYDIDQTPVAGAL